MKNLLPIICFAIVTSSILELRAQSNYKQDSVKSLNRHDFVKRGNQPNELKAGDYVIVGVALTESDAKLMVRQFIELRYPEPTYGYLTGRSYWCVGYGANKDIEAAKLKRDEYRKYKMYQNAYLLTVHQ